MGGLLYVYRVGMPFEGPELRIESESVEGPNVQLLFEPETEEGSDTVYAA